MFRVSPVGEPILTVLIEPRQGFFSPGESARFSQVFARRGLSLDFGGSWLLPRLIGLHKAKELALFGEIVSAREAEEMGLVNRVLPEDDLDAFVDDWADRLAADGYDPLDLGTPVEIRMRFASTTHVEVLMSIPGMSKVDGFTAAYTAADADEAYRLIRLMYRFVQP